ncbi:MAG: fluoride efflux transporter CrcB [Roseobacter sp.]
MTQSLVLVAVGGAIGASLRHLLGVGLYRFLGGPTQFPVAILSANVLGSFLMGVFVVMAAQRGLTHLSPFVMTGLLGGFTTFSAFSLETVTLIERGALVHAAFYVALSVALSVFGLMAGLWMTRVVLT